jgi:hypothetical protein
MAICFKVAFVQHLEMETSKSKSSQGAVMASNGSISEKGLKSSMLKVSMREMPLSFDNLQVEYVASSNRAAAKQGHAALPTRV